MGKIKIGKHPTTNIQHRTSNAPVNPEGIQSIQPKVARAAP